MNGLIIKDIREKLCLTQEELARMIGVHTRTVQNWEAGTKIPSSKHQILQSLLPSMDENTSTDDIRQRIKKVLADKDLSVASFCNDVGLPQATVNRQLNGGSKVSVETIKVFLQKFPNISAEWLLRGIGNECCGIPNEQPKCGNPNTQTMTDSAIVKENEMLKKSIEEKNEEIRFLRSLIQRNAD